MTELNRRNEHMYTNTAKNRGYVESTYQGGSINMKYYMNEYRDKLSSLNLVQENHILT